MNTRSLAFFFILSAAAFTASAAEANSTKHPPHTVPNTELRVLPRTRPDREYQLHISLPASFHEKTDKKYPVVFVTDGYWDFTTVVAIQGNLFYAKNVPEMIVVGLGYAGENLNYDAMRADDLSPMGPPGQNAGNAETFLEVIEKHAIPLLEREYRADPAHRYLMGCSNGGLFTLYALFTKPDLFQGYVADSPSVGSIFNFERAFAASGRTTDARVFISAGENEWPSYRKLIEIFHQRLEKDGVIKGGLKFRRVDNVRHAGTKPEIYTQGLLFVTTPIAPETGVQKDFMSDPQNRPAFGINFWPKKPQSELSATEVAALRAHDAWLMQLIQDKRVYMAGSTPSEAKQRFSGTMLFADKREAAEELAKSSGAVRSGLLAYEIIAIGE